MCDAKHQMFSSTPMNQRWVELCLWCSAQIFKKWQLKTQQECVVESTVLNVNSYYFVLFFFSMKNISGNFCWVSRVKKILLQKVQIVVKFK